MHMHVSELVENIPVCHENVYIVSFFYDVWFKIWHSKYNVFFYVEAIGQN